MPTFAKVEKGLPSQVALLDGDGLDDDASPSKERFGLAHAV